MACFGRRSLCEDTFCFRSRLDLGLFLPCAWMGELLELVADWLVALTVCLAEECTEHAPRGSPASFGSQS